MTRIQTISFVSFGVAQSLEMVGFILKHNQQCRIFIKQEVLSMLPLSQHKELP